MPQPDPLPSWREGPARRSILDFVTRVTTAGSRDYVPPADRIAVFDNDGTLWCEQPMQVQLYFFFDQMEELAKAEPWLKDRPPFEAFLRRDAQAIASLGRKAAFEVGFSVYAGMTADEFERRARTWFAGAKHPDRGTLFTDNIYVPQIELLTYLRANGFRTFIVSGGGVDLIRVFSEEKYGIPRDQVVGSSTRAHFEVKDGHAEIIKLAELGSWDDREAKPENIYLHIGRRPILVFGNSDGDLAMMRYARSSSGPSLALLLHHDDAQREFAYDRDFKLSPLVEALDHAGDYGLTIVSMKRDWAAVFGAAPSEDKGEKRDRQRLH